MQKVLFFVSMYLLIHEGTKVRVLIVEDDVISRKMIEMLMKPLAKECSLAKDGEIALDFFNESVEDNNNYDVVLLDIMLPKMDGQTLLHKFRQKEEEYNIFGKKGSKIVMISALGDAANVMEAFNNQCDGYLSKPYNKNKLMVELRKLELIK